MTEKEKEKEKLQYIKNRYILYKEVTENFARFVHDIYFDLVFEYEDTYDFREISNDLFYDLYFEEKKGSITKYLIFMNNRFTEMFDTRPEKVQKIIEEFKDDWFGEYTDVFPFIDFEDFIKHYSTYFDEALTTSTKLDMLNEEYTDELEQIFGEE